MICDYTISTLLLGSNLDYVLFKVAIDFGKQGRSVWFISIAPFEKIPENIEQPCREVLQLITFIYVKDYVDLIKHLNGIHKWQNIPDLIIVKDFERYCSLLEVDYDSVKTAFLSSTLLDSVTYLARKKNCVTFLLVCCSHLNDQEIIEDRLKIIFDMYFNNFLLNNESKANLIDSIEKDFLLNKTAIK